MQKKDLDYFLNVLEEAKKIFLEKTNDYGFSWKILRLTSLTDQILIKIKRIRRIEELNGYSKINEGVREEYLGIINYCNMALIKLWFPDEIFPLKTQALNEDKKKIELASEVYDKVIDQIKNLLFNKNHDYDNAWKELRISSITDLIMVKIYRIKHIEELGKTPLVSENIDSQYSDIVNYAVFAIIKHDNLLN